MIQGMYTGATGMKTHSDGMQIISHNISNVNTVGYKQQLMLFQDLMYQNLNLGTADIITSQKGMGSTLNDVRTLFTDGSFEPGNSSMDLAITGKGFFEVTDDSGRAFYTRAGNFRFDAEGVLRDPSGLAVSGRRIGENGEATGQPGPISINFKDAAIATDAARASTSLTAHMNINVPEDRFADMENPYFSLLQSWDATLTEPLSDTQYSQPLTFYDSQGVQRTATIHFDAASTSNGTKTLEYIVTVPPEQDGRAGVQGTAGAGLLMAGTLTFSSSGQLTDMSAFTPGGGDLKNLANWRPAALNANGEPQFAVTLPGQQPQTLSLNLGMTAGAGWEDAPASAADVGGNALALPSMGNPSYSSGRSMALPYSSSLNNYQQDGYPEGSLNNVYVDESGVIVGTYSNGQTHELYEIPLFRFTSEDGLRREGNNLYSATPDSGAMQFGRAGTENYGTVLGNYLETSNVDLSAEMVNMIIVQRGFQSNSKSITTVDAMIQRALELKRN